MLRHHKFENSHEKHTNLCTSEFTLKTKVFSLREGSVSAVSKTREDQIAVNTCKKLYTCCKEVLPSSRKQALTHLGLSQDKKPKFLFL